MRFHTVRHAATVTIAGFGLLALVLDPTSTAGVQLTAVRAPVFVAGIAGATQAAVGDNFYLVLLDDGQVLSWGVDDLGQLGHGTPPRTSAATGPRPAPETTPTPVVDLVNVVSIAAGAEHALAVRADGTIWAWGKNYENELGLGRDSPGSGRPVMVPGVAGAMAVSAYGNTSFALLRDGSVLGWGEHLWRVESRSDRERDVRSASPVRVPGVAAATAVRAGSPSLALLRDGTVLSWGGGYLGDGSPRIGNYSEVPPQPVRVTGITDAVAIASEVGSSGVVRRDGSVWVWGEGSINPLGLGQAAAQDSASADRATPVRIPALTGAVDLAIASARSVVLADGTVRAWGDGRLGATGRPGIGRLFVPTAIPGVNDVVHVWAAHYANLALTRDGRIRAWGSVPLPAPPR